MVGYYRLREMGFRLASGAHILPKEAVAPIEQATALVEEAEAVANRIVGEAKKAFEDERRRGYEEGLAQARMETVERLIGEGILLDRKLAEIESSLVDVVVASVRRLIHSFDDREKAISLVRAALKQMRREKKAELRVSPEQYQEMRTAIGDIIRDFPEVELVDVVEDATLAAPQIIVETGIGRVEGDLGRNLDALEQTLRGVAATVAAPEDRIADSEDGVTHSEAAE